VLLAAIAIRGLVVTWKVGGEKPQAAPSPETAEWVLFDISGARVKNIWQRLVSR
jgi:hypothetical protein